MHNTAILRSLDLRYLELSEEKSITQFVTHILLSRMSCKIFTKLQENILLARLILTYKYAFFLSPSNNENKVLQFDPNMFQNIGLHAIMQKNKVVLIHLHYKE